MGITMKIPTDWTFKSMEVSTHFDTHVREQLPWYDLATGVVAHVARHYISEGGLVYDIGASTGNISNAIKDTVKSRSANLISIDSSEAMRANYKGPNQLMVDDAVDFNYEPFDLAICFLVLQFIRPSVRRDFVIRLRSKIKAGGALVVFDKCQPVKGYVGTVLSRLSLAGKIASGVKPEEVIQKELSLSGIQRPIDVWELGLDEIEIFRFGDFAGWIIESTT